MQRVLTVEFAILHLFQTTGGIAFFFGRRIVAPFALGAFQNNQFAHFLKLSLRVDIDPGTVVTGGPGTIPLSVFPAALHSAAGNTQRRY